MKASGPFSARIDIPSLGDLAITMEPDGHGRLAITVPTGSPAFDLLFVGTEPSLAVSVNDTPASPRWQRSLFTDPKVRLGDINDLPGTVPQLEVTEDG
jgi:hypothetical protein